ncbi:MAG: rRNA maturation RNase YbeY [Cyanobacteria bacterium P01_D01_bin.156]
MPLPGKPEVELWVETADIERLVLSCELPDIDAWQSWFNIWLQVLNPTLSPINRYEVSLLLTDDAAIQGLNATYRHQDKATDVLAFAAQEASMPGSQDVYQNVSMPLGDLVISVETAQRQRHGANYSLAQELAWLAAHGFLHLLGWDHPDDDSLQKMLDQQAHLLQYINLAL